MPSPPPAAARLTVLPSASAVMTGDASAANATGLGMPSASGRACAVMTRPSEPSVMDAPHASSACLFDHSGAALRASAAQVNETTPMLASNRA